MTTRLLLLTVLLLLLAVVQTAVLPYLTVAGYRPDLLLLAAVMVAVRDGSEAGVRSGFVAGLLTDVLAESGVVGVAALSYGAVGYLVGAARPYLAAQSVTAPLVFGFAGSFLGTLVAGVLGGLLADRAVAIATIVGSALVVAVMHTLLAPVAVRGAAAFSARFPAEGTSVAR